MESTVLQADRMLLPLFVTVLVGFVTAALSIVRLVNDKEGKTSDHRQHWCDSLRTCLSDLVSCINSTASELVNRGESIDQLNKLLVQYRNPDAQWSASDEAVRDHLNEVVIDKDTRVRVLRKDLYRAYHFSRLHFKPNDPVFKPIESNFNMAMQLTRELAQMSGEENFSTRIERRNEIHQAADNITLAGQEVLKTEWEIVKRGERGYVLTKKWSIFGGGIALLVLLLFGIVAASSLSITTRPASSNDSTTKVTEHESIQALNNHVSSNGTPSVPSVTQIVNVGPAQCRLPLQSNPSNVPPIPNSECEKKVIK